MLDTAIVGAGLCGLALARQLSAQGLGCAVFEARERPGGRILSTSCATSGMALDLGATWYWPVVQPRMARLVSELGLTSFPQHDTGEVLDLVDHDKQPNVLERPNLHAGAQRVAGGMAALVETIVRDLPAGTLRFGQVLTGLVDHGDHVVLHFECGEQSSAVAARQVVLAIPPRLVEAHVCFDPPLDGAVCAAMRATPTHMADQAKVMVGFREAFWREAGHSGNAFVRHEYVVLGEIFDASDAEGARGALGGFFALPVSLRAALRTGMSMLVSSQLVQVFGPAAESGEQHLQDWAEEPYTCSAWDVEPSEADPEYGHPALRVPQWGGRLLFGGSETATLAGGYMEGALEAAARLRRAIQAAQPSARTVVPLSAAANDSSLAYFVAWVGERRTEVPERYRLRLGQLVATQQTARLTHRAALAAIEQVYSEALEVLVDLPLTPAMANGEVPLIAELLSPFRGINKALLDEAMDFNAHASATANFPEERTLSPEYLESIAGDLAAAWREFASGVDTLLSTRVRRRAPDLSLCV